MLTHSFSPKHLPVNKEIVNKDNRRAPNGKNKIKRNVFFSTLRVLMIALTGLYDKHLDLPKMTEQDNAFEYIVPPH